MVKQVDESEQHRYRAALATIWDRSSYDRGFINNPFAGDDEARRGLARTSAVLDLLGHPQERIQLVHVAGSKGKGSTSVLLDAILRAAGMRSGRFTSPHLHSYRERFIVDDELITEGAFASLTEQVMEAVRKAESTTPDLGRITAWELSTAMALTWFAERMCDVAVIEVGLGGTLDATNVIDPVVSAITRLDFEHTAILGETLPEIASNKAGIIKPGRPSVTVEQPDAALSVIQERARHVGSPLLVQNRDWFVEGDEDKFAVTGPWGSDEKLQTSLVGPHQVENAALAVAAIKMAFSDDSAVDYLAIRAGLRSAHHPGRFERVVREDRTIIIDGAHTPIAADALSAALTRHVSTEPVTFVIGMLQDKRPDPFLKPLIPRADRWIVARLDSPRTMPVDLLSEALSTLGQRVNGAPSIAAALDLALKDGRNTVVVTGSLTAAAEARVHLGLASPDPSPT
ncbi:MAG TPA: folylpolyglutamate synthase/dihydrofolate synthase family protein [Thermomicrobiales bacterium]|nr:folylpolyglutamate synthase/dihydrofolate synthase family protein [Thermomicrobiales bacterium]